MTSLGRDALVVALAGPLLGSDAMGKSAPKPMSPVLLNLGKPEYAPLATAGGSIKIPNPHDSKHSIIVTRTTDTTIAAISSKCTHFGCELPVSKDNVITCPCHGSKYDPTGKVLHGPTHKDLPRFLATIEGTMITIKDAAG
jgi:Rieske Fe-S protein